jgi:PEP-CTERM motif
MKATNAVIAAALLLASLPGTADAGLVIDVVQSGGDVVATASGSLDLADLTDFGSGDVIPSVNPRIADLIIGPPGGGPVDTYTGFSGPTNFGSHVITPTSSATGDIIGINGGLGYIFVPAGYVSGSALSGSMTLDNTTIAGMGMTSGTYTWTWGTGADADSLTVNIASVPEPSTLVLAGAALLAGLGTWVRRRGRRAA